MRCPQFFTVPTSLTLSKANHNILRRVINNVFEMCVAEAYINVFRLCKNACIANKANGWYFIHY